MTKLFKFVSAVQFLKKFIHLYQQNRKLKNLDQFFIQHIMNGQKSIIQKTKIFYVLNFINFKTFFFSKLQIFNLNFFSIQIQDDVKINEIFFSAKPPKKLNLIFLFVKKCAKRKVRAGIRIQNASLLVRVIPAQVNPILMHININFLLLCKTIFLLR